MSDSSDKNERPLSEGEFDDEEEEEMDLNDDFGDSEQGEEEVDEEGSAAAPGYNAGFANSDEDEFGDEPADDDALIDGVLTTNLENKRDEAIQSLLLKEDLGIIQMRLKDTVKVLQNFKELRDDEKNTPRLLGPTQGRCVFQLRLQRRFGRPSLQFVPSTRGDRVHRGQ